MLRVNVPANLRTGTSAVSINGTNCTGIINDSATQVRATIASGTTTGALALTATGGRRALQVRKEVLDLAVGVAVHLRALGQRRGPFARVMVPADNGHRLTSE
jgi:hypothetical protein